MNPPLIELLYRAINSEFGIVVTTSNPELLRQKLYAERKAANDPDLARLSFTLSRTNPESQLLLVKK